MNNEIGIKVYDNLFSLSDRQFFYDFIRNSNFRIMGGAGLTINHSRDVSLQSMYSEQDLNNFGIQQIFPNEIKSILSEYKVERSYALIVDPLQNPHFHADGHSKYGLTLVYYANLYWELDWGGETVFMDDTLQEVIYTSVIKPGRLVIFDSKIPHKPNTPTSRADNFRLTFVINYVKT